MSDSTAASGFVEHRLSPRRQIDRPAWIDFGTGGEPRDCTLWDISETGVRFTCQAPAEVPKEFILLLTGDGSERRRCEVIWRSEGQVGARYLGALARGRNA